MSGRRVTNTDGQGATQTGGLIPSRVAAQAAAVVVGAIMPHCERIEIAGSLRRGREMVHDADLVIIPRGNGTKLDERCEMSDVRSGEGRGAARMRVVQIMKDLHVGAARDFRAGEKMVSAVVRAPAEWTKGTEEAQWTEVMVDIYFATVENFGMILCVRTGSAQHNVYLARMARSIDLEFAAGSGVKAPHGEILGARTEEEVFGAFGLAVPAPEEREIVCGIPKWMEKPCVRAKSEARG